MEYWQRPERERKLFICQIEALETAIYLAEVAPKYGDAWIENALRAANDSANPLLYQIAFNMATGSGKTVFMAMLIAWQVLNKLANRQDARFSDTFLIVTPGITIRHRLRGHIDAAEACARHAWVGRFRLPETRQADGPMGSPSDFIWYRVSRPQLRGRRRLAAVGIWAYTVHGPPSNREPHMRHEPCTEK